MGKNGGARPGAGRPKGSRNTETLERMAVRQAVIKAARLHTDEIVGTLAQQMRGDIADILPEEEILKRAKEKGISQLIKRLKVITRYIPQQDGDDIAETRVELELYSSQKAAEDLADIFGLKKEPAKNPYDEARNAVKTLLDKYPSLDPERAKMIISEAFGVEVDQISDTIS